MEKKIAIGEVVEAQVYRVEPYGIFCRYADREIFVHLSELSWTDHRPANIRDLLNRLQHVKILSRHSEKDQWVGSVKRAFAERNPFGEIAAFPDHKVLKGTVTYKTLDAFFVRLENGVEGIIARSEVNRELRKGDDVAVYVMAIDADCGKLQLRLKE